MKLFFAIMSLGLALNTAYAIEPVVPPAPQEDTERFVSMVRGAVTTYTLALQDLGVTRKRPIKIKLSNNVSDYETHVSGYVVEYKDRQARWTNGLAYLDEDTLMIKAIPPYDKVEMQRRIWHEMTHSLQYDLSSGNAIRARPWLAEGMAGLFTFLAGGKSDADSIKQWKVALHRQLSASDGKLNPADLVGIDDFNWDILSETSQGANYALADLIVLNFYETNGAASIPRFAAYYDCLAHGLRPENSCFVEHLGMTPEKFVQR
jgi:hypothetical protein